GSHLDALHDERPEFSSAHIEPEVRPFHVAIEGSDGRPDDHLSPLDQAYVLVPEDEAAEAAVIPQLEVHDPPGGPVLAREGSDRRDPGDRRPQVRLHAFLEVRDPRERRYAPS